MTIREMIERPASWLDAAGDEPEIVLSTRVRLARNVESYRFAHNATNEELEAVLNSTRDACDSAVSLGRVSYFDMGEIGALDRQFLAERHLASREFLFSTAQRALVVDPSETLSIMVNEEDHLRIQAYAAGFSLRKAFDLADSVDTELAGHLGFAYSDRLGYLTACPTNLGTGLRASLLVHLPGLVHSKEIHKLLDSLRQLNHTIRGFYGEGTEVMGNFFQLSNNATLGTPEAEIVSHLKEMVAKVISFEKRSRDMLLRKARSLLEDKVWRAYGLLRHSRSVSTKEALSLISAVRLGVGAGIITDLPIPVLNRLLIYIQPAHLQAAGERQMDAHERDVARATYIRATLESSRNDEED